MRENWTSGCISVRHCSFSLIFCLFSFVRLFVLGVRGWLGIMGLSELPTNSCLWSLIHWFVVCVHVCVSSFVCLSILVYNFTLHVSVIYVQMRVVVVYTCVCIYVYFSARVSLFALMYGCLSTKERKLVSGQSVNKNSSSGVL